MKRIFMIFCLSIFVYSCSSDDDDMANAITVDFSEFKEFEEEDVQPYPRNIEYPSDVSFVGFATRAENGNLYFEEIFGDCDMPEPEDCFDIDALDPRTGFQACKGLYGYDCHDFLIAVRSGEVEVINNISEFRDLTGGEIDTLPEVLFVLRADSFRVETNNIETGAYKEVNDGFEIIATKLISDCAPIVANRYHLKVLHSGEIKVLAEEEYFRSEYCI
ncbi:hypothetical protein [Zunongwangia sp. H14]|uniref:hypothetical protein n=1 Tax=Zunongwangia sp. H14 TaxID=3240792 RepID=UPI0035617488